MFYLYLTHLPGKALPGEVFLLKNKNMNAYESIQKSDPLPRLSSCIHNGFQFSGCDLLKSKDHVDLHRRLMLYRFHACYNPPIKVNMTNKKKTKKRKKKKGIPISKHFASFRCCYGGPISKTFTYTENKGAAALTQGCRSFTVFPSTEVSQ